MIRTKLPGPNARRILADDARLISPSYTRSYPLVAQRGRGIVIEDVDGNEFFDFSAGIAVCSTGHCHPEVVAAVQAAGRRADPHVGHGLLLPAAHRAGRATLADRAHARPAPRSLRQLRDRSHRGRAQTRSLPHQAPLRDRLLRSFHGRTMGALSLTCSKAQQRRRFAPLVPGVIHAPFPNLYRRPAGATPSSTPATPPASSKTSSSAPSCLPRNAPPSSSKPSRARADTCPRRPPSCRSCATSATATASCWSSTKCSPAWDAPANGGPSNTPGSPRT